MYTVDLCILYITTNSIKTRQYKILLFLLRVYIQRDQHILLDNTIDTYILSMVIQTLHKIPVCISASLLYYITVTRKKKKKKIYIYSL